MSAAKELRAAAAKLRDTAAKATPGPWNASPVWSPRSHVTSAVYSYAHPTGTAESEVIPSVMATKKRALLRPGDAEWIALANPALAERMANSLEQHAEDHLTYDCEWPECSMVELASAINGGMS